MFVLPVHPSPADTTAAPPAAGSGERDSFFEFLDRVRDDRGLETRPERSDIRANDHASDHANDRANGGANNRANNLDNVSHDMRADHPPVGPDASAIDRTNQTSAIPGTGTPATGNPANTGDASETHPLTGVKPGKVGLDTGQNMTREMALNRVLDAAGTPDTAIELRGGLQAAVLANVGRPVLTEPSGAVTADPETGIIEPHSASGEPGVSDGGENAKAGKSGPGTPDLPAAPHSAPAVNSTPDTSTPNTQNAARGETRPAVAPAAALAPDTLPAIGTEATQNSGGAAAIGAEVTARREALRQGAPNSGSPAIPASPATTPGAPLDGAGPDSDAETARSKPDVPVVNANASGKADNGGDGAKAKAAVTARSGSNTQNQGSATPTAGAQPTDNPTETLKAAVNDTLPPAESLARTASDARPTAQNAPTVQAPGAAPIANDLRLASGVSTLTETAAGRNASGIATQQVAIQISRAVSQNNDRFTIDLKPATLGRISVTMEIGHDNRVIAIIQAERPETLELLQRDQRALERALQEAGLKTDSGSLSFSLHGGGKEELAGDEQNTRHSHVSVSMEDEKTGETTRIYARPVDGAGLDISV